MDKQWHLIIGGIAFLLYQTFLDNFDTTIHFNWIIGLVLVAIGSVFPDTLEPANNRYHRGLFHSYGTLVIVLVCFIVSAITVSFSHPFPNLTLVYFVSCFFLGYIFHLLADSTTQRDLPG
jgi:hypothetical protein